MKRVRQLIESVVFAGMRPAGAKSEPSKKTGWLGPLSGPVQRFLDGGSKPLDPLYLTNQSTGQKVRRGLLIASPFVVIGIVILVALTNIVPAGRKQEKDLTSEEVAARMLPNLAKDIKIDSNTDVQVVKAVVSAGANAIVSGTVRNNTDRVVGSAELIFDLTDDGGSQVGGVSTTVNNIPAKTTTTFQFPIKQRDAAFVLVREVVLSKAQ